LKNRASSSKNYQSDYYFYTILPLVCGNAHELTAHARKMKIDKLRSYDLIISMRVRDLNVGRRDESAPEGFSILGIHGEAVSAD